MSSCQPLRRLAFRPLSSRWQCRFASNVQRPTSTRESAAGGLVNDLLRSPGRQQQQQRPTAFAERTARAQPGPRREPAQFLAMAESSVMSRVEAKAKEREAERLEALRQPFTRSELERQASRRWQVGEVYAPHDLTGVEMAKWKKLTPPRRSGADAFDQLGINPLREYKVCVTDLVLGYADELLQNFSMLAEFVTETGRIRTRKETGLRPVNQRRVARAIRRAMGIGLMPKTYKHPELLKREAERRRR
ncbi:hypothetical protein AMS68_001482 [Peltaster fructicola]|uniref:Small ribosomal subunit protein bS18m n=1 Tax=Peltaster fructicola TaxID=286661 RepID=A0A6H0XMV4_9PEZI|nr:hypothetical protein AMS68_001482 [Peltaster fructicola]